MKKLLIVLISLTSLSLATAQQKKAPPTAAQKAQINTEAREYTGKACTGKATDYFREKTEPDPSMMMMGGMMQGMINQQFDAMLDGMAKEGLEIRKVSAVQGGKRAYLYDKKSKQGMYMLMQITSGSLLMHGCVTK